MEIGTFYGVTLSENERLSQFEVGGDTESYVDHRLIIKQIYLGADAKDGEFNVVQAETRSSDDETVKIPIAVLKAGETRALRPNIEFPSSSVTFKLIKGSGPVHITGQQVMHEMDWYGAEEEDGDSEEDYSDDQLQPPPQTNGKNTQKKK